MIDTRVTMKVFVINLATATERLAYMADQLGAFERVEAVRGTAVPERFAANFRQPTPLLPGEIGCYASHLLAAEAVLARGLPYAVILEDDVEIAADFMETVDAALGNVPRNWDILSLSGAKQHPHCTLSRLGNESYLVRYLHFPKTTAAYVISPSGCRKLLAERRRKRPVDVDIRYGWEMGMNGFGVFPPPAWQSGKFASSIPKAKQRFYWRADPVGYLAGRVIGVFRLGIMNLIRAYVREFRVGRRPHRA